MILVVEDEDSIRLTLRDYLRKKGHEVIVASDGVGAIKQILDHPVDLVVTDYRMDILGRRLLDTVPAGVLPGQEGHHHERLSPARVPHPLSRRVQAL